MRDWTIRPATVADRDELLRMRTLLWPDSQAAEVDTVLARDRSELGVLVAERPAGGLCGFAEIGIRPFAEGCEASPVAYVEGIWVDAIARRASIGRALLREAEAWARERGLQEMASDCDLENLASLAFHRSCGFEEVQRIICLRRDLGPAG